MLAIQFQVKETLFRNWDIFEEIFKACDIQIESFGYDMTDLAFGWSKMTAVELSRRIELPQFILRG